MAGKTGAGSGGSSKKKPAPTTSSASRKQVVKSINRQPGVRTYGPAVAKIPKYGQGPIKVYAAKSASAATVQKATRAWNNAANAKVFKTTTSKKQADVVVKSQPKSYSVTKTSGFTNLRPNSKTRVVTVPKYKASTNLVAHELGHAAGLDHPRPNAKNQYRNPRRIMGAGFEPSPREGRAVAKLNKSRRLKTKQQPSVKASVKAHKRKGK